MMEFRDKRGGVTLIELMVVVSITGILMSLIAMATISAREKGRMAMCVNNHKQLVITWLLYTSDNDDKLVPNADSVKDRQEGRGWVVGNVRNNLVATNTVILLDMRISLFAGYIQNSSAYKCPSDESVFVRSVAMNCRLNPTRFDGKPAWVGGLGESYKTFRNLSEIKYPSRIMTILDERHDSINDPYFAVDLSNTGNPFGNGKVDPYIIVDFPGDYHNKSLTSSFADGHVRTHKWVDYVRKRPLNQAMARISTSPMLKDIKWLHNHASYKL